MKNSQLNVNAIVSRTVFAALVLGMRVPTISSFRSISTAGQLKRWHSASPSAGFVENYVNSGPAHGQSYLSAGASQKSQGVNEMSAQMKDIRKQMEQDEQVALLMRGLRGQNLNDDNAAAEGVEMLVVEIEDNGNDSLPLTYQPDRLKEYFSNRPSSVATRMTQIISKSGGFLAMLLNDAALGRLESREVERAAALRDVLTGLGPFFIKLGQALSIRPDILSPRAMVELQQLCDKVPSYSSVIAFATIEKELGRPIPEIFSEITPEPIAAASLGQVYRATLRENGLTVAVKVQRPFVLETVSLDLYLVRELGMLLRKIPFLADRTDVVALIDEFASRFYDELDYVKECENGLRIREDMKEIKQVVIPDTYPAYCSRRVHVAEWVDGEKLSQSTATDVLDLVNVGVVAYLTQLLGNGFFHADPHPGNMLRTPEGKLCILDFGLMTEITDDQKYGMIEAISHLVHRDYSAIGDDFKKLDFIPPDIDVEPIIPALTNIFDAALSGGGAKSINFQELAADLAQVTFEYPFRIPPYFALVIRAIGVLEGIALVGNEDFAIVDEAYPYISKRLLTDDSPRLRAALKYMVYGKEGVFDADRMIDLLQAFESFKKVTKKETGGGGYVDLPPIEFEGPNAPGGGVLPAEEVVASIRGANAGSILPPSSYQDAMASNAKATAAAAAAAASTGSFADGGNEFGRARGLVRTEEEKAADEERRIAMEAGSADGEGVEEEEKGGDDAAVREALDFFFSPEGEFFREFLTDETVRGVDALSRQSARRLAKEVGVNTFLPSGVKALAPPLSDQEELVIENTIKLVNFFLGTNYGGGGAVSGGGGAGGEEAIGGANAIWRQGGQQQQQRAGMVPEELMMGFMSGPNGGAASNRAAGRGLDAMAPSLPLRGRPMKLSANPLSPNNPLNPFFIPNLIARNSPLTAGFSSSASSSGSFASGAGPAGLEPLAKLSPVLQEYGPAMREFGLNILARLTEKMASRAITYAGDAILGPEERR